MRVSPGNGHSRSYIRSPEVPRTRWSQNCLIQELPCDVAHLGLPQCVEQLPDRGRRFIEAPEDYQVDALIRLLDDPDRPAGGIK
jgi:hypothetical protein